MTTTLTNAKAIIYDRETRDFAAYFDGELIGFFASYLAAECALNDHALSLIQDGLADLPLALLDDPQPAPEPTPPQPWPEPRPFPVA